MSIDKLTAMEDDLKDYMLKYSEDEDDALSYFQKLAEE